MHTFVKTHPILHLWPVHFTVYKLYFELKRSWKEERKEDCHVLAWAIGVIHWEKESETLFRVIRGTRWERLPQELAARQPVHEEPPPEVWLSILKWPPYCICVLNYRSPRIPFENRKHISINKFHYYALISPVQLSTGAPLDRSMSANNLIFQIWLSKPKNRSSYFVFMLFIPIVKRGY